MNKYYKKTQNICQIKLFDLILQNIFNKYIAYTSLQIKELKTNKHSESWVSMLTKRLKEEK